MGAHVIKINGFVYSIDPDASACVEAYTRRAGNGVLRVSRSASYGATPGWLATYTRDRGYGITSTWTRRETPAGAIDDLRALVA